MAAIIGALRAVLSASIGQFEADMGKAARAVEQFGARAQKVGKQVQRVGRNMSLWMTAPIVGVGAAVVKTASDFEAGMNRVAAATRAPKKQIEDMAKLARELGPQMGVGPTEVADAMENLAKNGRTVEDILGGATAAVVKLAKSAGAQLGPAADVATDIMAQFGKTAADMGQVVDQVNGVLIASKLDFDGYRLALGQAGGVAGAAGIDFEDFNAAIAATASLFASGSDAGTSFKTFLTRLSPQSKEARDLIEKLGLSFYDAQGQMRSMGQIAEELRQKLGPLSEEERNRALTVIFGTDAMRTAIGLMQQGAAGIEDYRRQVAAVSADDQMAARTAGFAGALAKMKAALQELAITIAESGFIQFLTDAVKYLTDVVRWIRENTGEWGNFALVIAAVAAALGPAIVAVGGIITALGGIATVIRVAVIPALALFLAHPVIAGGVILGAAIGLLIDNFETLVGWVQDACEWLTRMTTIALNPALGVALEQKRAQVQAFFQGVVKDAQAAAAVAVQKSQEAAASKAAVAGAVQGAIKNLPFMAAAPATVPKPQGNTCLCDPDPKGGGKVKDLTDDLKRAAEQTQELAKNIGRDLRPELGGLAGKLREVEDRFTSMREQVEEQRRDLEELGAQGVDVSLQMAELDRVLGDITASHEKAAAAARAQYAAENELANLDAQRQMLRQGQEIRDLKQARGDNGAIPESMLKLQAFQDQLDEDRIQALGRLRELEMQREEAERIGDTDALGRLSGIIALQREYYGVLETTTAKQLQDQERVQGAWTTFENDLSSELTDAVMDWKISLADIGQIFANLARDLWVKPFMEGFAGSLSGALQGKGFEGWFAEGGLIPAGGWGMVGEVGMERARWTPKGIEVEPVRGGDRGGVTVIQNISTPDLPTFRRTARQTSREARSQFQQR